MFGTKIKRVIKIEGMHCEHCAKKVVDVLSTLEDVKKVKVNLKNKEAVLSLANDIDADKIKDAIKEIGFEVTEIV